MMDWSQDDRNTDPNWEADWHRGIAIGLLVIVGLAVVMAIVRPQLGSSRRRLQRNSTQSGPHNVDYVRARLVQRRRPLL